MGCSSSSPAVSGLSEKDIAKIKEVQDVWLGTDEWDRNTSFPVTMMKKWFSSDDELDKQLRDKFESSILSAASFKDAWMADK